MSTDEQAGLDQPGDEMTDLLVALRRSVEAAGGRIDPLPDHGTAFTETETLLAALEGEDGEVRARVGQMTRSERRDLGRALSTIRTAMRATDPTIL